MPGPVIADPIPDWLKPENASVTDSALTKAMRMIGHLIGADNPTSQVLGLMMSDVPSSGEAGGLSKAVAGLKDRVIKAYHGSPHDFERFSLEKIGTGEGAQAYGHGLYFAENPSVAKDYQKALSPENRYALNVNGERLSFRDAAKRALGEKTGGDLATYYESGDAARRLKMDQMSTLTGLGEKLKQQGHQVEYTPLGRMYEVAIHADPEDFLDWDKPLSQQSEKVRAKLLEAMKQRGLPTDETGVPLWAQRDPTGEAMHAAIAKNALPTQREAQAGGAEVMKQAGIPGIKYLDQGSRMMAKVQQLGDKGNWFFTGSSTPYPTQQAAQKALDESGQVSRNYVVFDDRLIDILKKYGLLLPAAGAATQGQALISPKGPQ